VPNAARLFSPFGEQSIWIRLPYRPCPASLFFGRMISR
jgi:hypothetical protein